MLVSQYRNQRGRVRTVSRANEWRLKTGEPEMGISLSKRRIWWADGDDTDDGEQDDSPKYNPKDLEEAKKIIDSLSKRVDERDATINQLREGQQKFEERISAMERAARQRSEQDGDFKKLYEETLAELEKVKPDLERGKSAIERIRASNEARIAKIPELLRKAVPGEYAPEKLQTWLDENEGWMLRQPAPDYDAGVGGNGGDPVKPKLSAEEKEAARLMGLSEEEMLAAKGDES